MISANALLSASLGFGLRGGLGSGRSVGFSHRSGKRRSSSQAAAFHDPSRADSSTTATNCDSLIPRRRRGLRTVGITRNSDADFSRRHRARSVRSRVEGSPPTSHFCPCEKGEPADALRLWRTTVEVRMPGCELLHRRGEIPRSSHLGLVGVGRVPGEFRLRRADCFLGVLYGGLRFPLHDPES